MRRWIRHLSRADLASIMLMQIFVFTAWILVENYSVRLMRDSAKLNAETVAKWQEEVIELKLMHGRVIRDQERLSQAQERVRKAWEAVLQHECRCCAERAF